MQLCLSSSFRERRSITMTSRRSHTPTTPERRGRISRYKAFDWASSCTVCRGFDYEQARVELRIPNEFQVEAMAVVGRPGAKEVLPEKLQKRESPNDRRRLTESICEGPFRS
jgi:hypothetical protein